MAKRLKPLEYCAKLYDDPYIGIKHLDTIIRSIPPNEVRQSFGIDEWKQLIKRLNSALGHNDII